MVTDDDLEERAVQAMDRLALAVDDIPHEVRLSFDTEDPLMYRAVRALERIADALHK